MARVKVWAVRVVRAVVAAVMMGLLALVMVPRHSQAATVDQTYDLLLTVKAQVDTVNIGLDVAKQRIGAINQTVPLIKDVVSASRVAIDWGNAVVAENQKRIGLARDEIKFGNALSESNQTRINSVKAVADAISSAATYGNALSESNQTRINSARTDIAAVKAETARLVTDTGWVTAVTEANQERINQANASLSGITTAVSSSGAIYKVAADSKTFAEQSVNALAGVKTVVDAIGPMMALGNQQIRDLMANDRAALDQMRLELGKLGDEYRLDCQAGQPVGPSPWSIGMGDAALGDCASTQRSDALGIDRVIRALRALNDAASDRDAARAAGDRAAEERAQGEADRRADELGQALADGQDRADAAADRIVRELERLGGADGAPGGGAQPNDTITEGPAMPRLGGWVGAAECLQSTVSGFGQGGLGCQSGPSMTIAGATVYPLSWCIETTWLSRVTTVAGIIAVLGGFLAGLRALLSALSLGVGVPTSD